MADDVRVRATCVRVFAAKEFHGWAVMKPKEKLQPWTYNVSDTPASKEIDIRVTHNGVCHTDIHMRDDDWGISKFPFVPGHEVVGEVVAVGSGVTQHAVGDRVGVGWIRDSCRACKNCLRGEENICLKGYTGLIVGGNNGGFQAVMRAPADFAYKIPDAMDSADAAPLLCAGVTVYAPLRKYIKVPGMKVAVLGVGGLGHLALQFAAAMGAEVTAIDIFPEKEGEAKGFGAHRFLEFNTAMAQCGSSFDLVLNCASARVDFAKVLATLMPDGNLVQIGIPGGAVIQVPLQDLVFGQKRVIGSIVGGRADMQEMLDFAGLKGVKPMLERFPLSQVNEALDRVASGKARYRVVLDSDKH